MVTRSGDNPYLKKKGARLSSFVVKRMFTQGDPSPVSHNDLSPESCLQFYWLLAEADKEQRIYEKPQVGILLLK